MQQDVMAIIRGAVAGCIATVAMSAVTMAARQAGLLGRHPPEDITEAALDAGGLHRSEETQDALAVLLHFGFGIAVGAPFGLLSRRVRFPLNPSVLGAVYGTLVWAASYKGWIPALGILPPPERDRPGRQVSMVVAHWVYGGTLGAMVGRR